MKVTLKVVGHLSEFYPGAAAGLTLELEHPATITEILRRAGIPPELPGAVICNQERVSRSHMPADGDVLLVLSPMSGG